jgi:hypothetical protein
MRFKAYSTYINESTLSGNSRSGGMSKWDYYIKPYWKKSDGYVHTLAKDSEVLASLETKEVQSNHTKGTKLQIMSTNVTKSGVSTFAKIQIKGESKSGFVSIGKISKPESSKDGDQGSVIGGGANSKEFTPDKLDLGGEEFSSSSALVSTVKARLNQKYNGEEYKAIKEYLSDFVKQISGTALTEGKAERFTKVYSTTTEYPVAASDIKILSKNFGEVIGALYIIHTNKKMNIVGFPSNISEGLYDFYGKDRRGRMHYYSVKSAGGSSTSLMNLNFIKKNFSANNTFVQKYMDELEAIDVLVNYKGRNTVGNITDWFKSVEPAKVKKITTIMSKGAKLSSLDQVDLAIWIKTMRKKRKEKDFLDIMNNVYDKVLSDQSGKTPKSSVGALKDMFKTSSNNEYQGGYLTYPLGSYIVSYMNGKSEYKEALNLLANFGTFISQCTVDMAAKSTTIKIIKFSKNEFRFSYNGMSKAPGNRPIGFKEA